MSRLRKLCLFSMITITGALSALADPAGPTAGAAASSWRARFSDWRVSRDPNGSLESAIEFSDLAGVQQALRLGANPNLLMSSIGDINSVIKSNSFGDTVCRTEPILAHMLRYYPHLEITNALLAAGADLNHSATYYISHYESDPDPEAPGITTHGPVQPIHDLFVDIAEISEPIFTALISPIARLNRETINNALLAACRAGHTNIVRSLLHHSADVNYLDQQMTPLSAAVSYGHVDLAQLLLEQGANVNPPIQFRDALGHISTNYAGNILRLAVGKDDCGLIKLLLAADAALLSQVPFIIFAVKSIAVLDLLVAAGLDINAPSILNIVSFNKPDAKVVIRALILAGARVTPEALQHHAELAKIYAEVMDNSRRLQAAVATESITTMLRAIRAGTLVADLLSALQRLVAEVKSDAIYEIIDGLVLNKIELKAKDTSGCTRLDAAVLANNYKAVDALLLHDLRTSDLHPDTLSNASACFNGTINLGAAETATETASLALDYAGNIMLGTQKIGEIFNWSKAVDSTIEQLGLPTLRVADLNTELCTRLEIDESRVLEFAKFCLILKLLQDSDMAQSSLAVRAIDGGATGFLPGSIPMRYTSARNREILETLRMQLAERDSQVAGLQQAAILAPSATREPCVWIEMVPLHGGHERYANQAAGRHPLQDENNGWSEGKEGNE